MPLFHFNVMGGVSDIDIQGTELSDVDAAWHEARCLASGIITHGFELLHKPYSIEQLSQILRKTATWQRRRRLLVKQE